MIENVINAEQIFAVVQNMADDIDEEHVVELAYKENCGFDSWVPMDKESFDSWPEMLQIREVAYRLKIEGIPKLLLILIDFKYL